jgi:hypothetical protein
MLPESGPLKKADRQKLANALKKLPPQLAYLSKGILSVAGQDQDMLGTGGGDVTPLEKCVQRERKKRREDIDAAGDAAALQEWAERFQRVAAASWSGPIFFAVGYLYGYEMFAGDEEPPEIPKPVKEKPGPQRTIVDIPAGLKVKQFVGGFEAKNREVQIFYIELDEQTYAIMVEQDEHKQTKKEVEFRRKLNPGVESSIDKAFQIGNIQGSRVLVTRNGRAIICEYLVKAGDAKIRITFLSRSDDGTDLQRYEPMLATIRPK